jgi:hypothetical protein
VTLVELLTTVHQAGINLRADGDSLAYDAPAGALTPCLRAALIERKPDLLAIVWRLKEMQRLAVEAPKAVLYARESARGGPGHCFSCGDMLDHPDAYGRCVPCDVASDIYYSTIRAAEDAEVTA